MKPHQLADLPPETLALTEKLNACCADAPIRSVAANVAKVASWNERTGGTQGISLDSRAVAALHTFLSHHLSLPNVAVSEPTKISKI